MKTFTRSLALPMFAGLLAAANVSAVTFTNLYDFSLDAFQGGTNPQATNSDGTHPVGLVISGDTIYGTAFDGGANGYGSVFRVNKDGLHFTNLFNFNLGTFDPGTVTYPDSLGANPNPRLLLVSNTLYGTTFYGGTHDAGSIFKINTDGTSFSVLHSFNFTDGQGPSSGLTLYSNALYGTAAGGGTN